MGQDLSHGALIGGRFRLDRLLGKGGMGQVWAATHEVTGREHALKFLNTPDASAELRARFLREARAASRVDHPNVITVQDAFELEDGTQVMVMDLLRGETLRDELERREVLTASEAADIFLPVVSAVGSAHAKGIVHRDLKPENVFLVDGADAADRVKVLDFGIAKLTEHDGETMTQTGQVMGTPAYMALEQCTGEREVDHRADVWAIGVMLFEALSGGRPIEADTLGQMVAKLLRQGIPPLSTLAPDTPKPLAELVDRMLCREADGRPADLCEVAAVLSPLATVEVPSFRAAGATAVEEDEAPSSRPASLSSLADPEAPTEHAGGDTAAEVAATITAADAAPGAGRSRLALVMLTGAALAMLAAGAVWFRGDGDDRAAMPAPSATASASAPPYSAGLEAFLPFPKTNDAALKAYAAALRAGLVDWVPSELWEQALQLDPNLTGVHARLAWYHFGITHSLDLARDHYAQALVPGGQATPFERGLLRCLEPSVQRQPADAQASSECYEKLAETLPGSPEARFYYGLSLTFEDNTSCIAQLAKAIELAPRYALALGFKAQSELYLGRFDDADQSLGRALELAPTSSFVRQQNVYVNTQRGHCQHNLDAARQVIAGNPKLDSGYLQLAQALAALHRPDASVEVALDKARDIHGREERWELWARPSVLGYEVRLAMLRGELDGAEQKALELERRADRVQQLEPHAWPARWLVQIYLEMDRADDAARVAESFLERKDAWEEDPRTEDYAIAKDAVPTMWLALRRAGKLRDDELAARRKTWLDAWRARSPFARNIMGYLWLRGFGDLADDEAQARAALTALDELGPIPPFRPRTLGAAGAGRAYLYAGRVDEALPWLEAATRDCGVLAYPYESTLAHFSLGQAREAKGDSAGACASYQVVLDRWGHATPSSLTAEAARSRVQALRCGAFEAQGRASAAPSTGIAPAPTLATQPPKPSASPPPPPASGKTPLPGLITEPPP